MEFSEIEKILIESGKLGDSWRKQKKEEEKLVEKFWTFLHDHEYWKEFLAEVLSVDIDIIKSLICDAYRVGKPWNFEIWIEGETINFRLRDKNKTLDERGCLLHDYWLEYYPIKNLEKIDEIGKRYILEGRTHHIEERIKELEEDKDYHAEKIETITAKIKELESLLEG